MGGVRAHDLFSSFCQILMLDFEFVSMLHLNDETFLTIKFSLKVLSQDNPVYVIQFMFVGI